MARFVIIEDEFLVALDLQDGIRTLGHDVVGIVPDSKSLAAVDLSDVDAALVDLHLRDGVTGPDIGAMLAGRGITVLFITANPSLLGDGIAGTIGVLTKPTDREELASAVRFLLARRQGETAAPPHRLKVFASR